ncbi:MAG TPA: helix-hairpin-helix domain-containing protein, partial [Anaerolineales bacterium]
MDDKRYWIGFNLIRGIGAVRLQALLHYFGDLEAAWSADAAALAEAGLGAKVIERIVEARVSVDLGRLWGKIEADGITVLTWQDE